MHSLRIDNETGDVYLSGPVPTDTKVVEVELVATDGGGKSSTAKLHLTIRDEFPEAPRFDSHVYNATIVENRDRFQPPVRVRVSTTSCCRRNHLSYAQIISNVESL